MTNGFQHAGTIGVGGQDAWTFSANAGDGIVLRMGTAHYNPLIQLHDPDGVLVGRVDGSLGVRDAELVGRATHSGTFRVVVSSLAADESWRLHSDAGAGAGNHLRISRGTRVDR